MSGKKLMRLQFGLRTLISLVQLVPARWNQRCFAIDLSVGFVILGSVAYVSELLLRKRRYE
jgi:hypothetical protein